MPKFTKDIVTEGKYRQYDKATKSFSKVVELKASDLGNIVDTFNKMKSKGLKVPAPWKHDLGIHTFTKIEKGDDGVLEDSSKNAGFWERLELAKNAVGKTVLRGVIDAPGSEDDPNTPAGKIGKTVKDTSIYLKDKYQLTDESGEIIDNAIMHIAVVTHPIEPGQSNFESLDSNVITMSQMIQEGDDPSPPNPVIDDSKLGELISSLKDCCKLYVPEGTTIENLIPNLLIAVKQYEMLHEEESGNSENPNYLKVDPIIMSMSKEQIDAIVGTKAVNPATGKPFVAEDFNVKEDTSKTLLMSVISQLEATKKNQYTERVKNLVSTGRVTDEYANTHLLPKAVGYSFNEETKGEDPVLDSILMSLEALPEVKPTANKGTEGLSEEVLKQLVMGQAPDLDGQVTEEDLAKNADYIASHLN